MLHLPHEAQLPSTHIPSTAPHLFEVSVLVARTCNACKEYMSYKTQPVHNNQHHFVCFTSRSVWKRHCKQCHFHGLLPTHITRRCGKGIARHPLSDTRTPRQLSTALVHPRESPWCPFSRKLCTTNLTSKHACATLAQCVLYGYMAATTTDNQYQGRNTPATALLLCALTCSTPHAQRHHVLQLVTPHNTLQTYRTQHHMQQL